MSNKTKILHAAHAPEIAAVSKPFTTLTRAFSGLWPFLNPN